MSDRGFYFFPHRCVWAGSDPAGESAGIGPDWAYMPSTWRRRIDSYHFCRRDLAARDTHVPSDCWLSRLDMELVTFRLAGEESVQRLID